MFLIQEKQFFLKENEKKQKSRLWKNQKRPFLCSLKSQH